MDFQAGESKIEDYSFWERVRIFFVQKRFRETNGNTVRIYKLYKGRKVLIREERYRDDY